MKLIRIDSASDGVCRAPDAARVISLGFFDGLHRGHRELLDRAGGVAEERGLESAVFTFADEGVKPGESRLMSFEEKLDALDSSGIFTVFAASFDAVRSLSPEEFVRDVLVGRCGARVAVCGFNFRFGRDASGDAEELARLMKRYGGEAIVLDAIKVEGETVSSSAIRAALAGGDVTGAAMMLGYPYTLTSPVEHGARIGRTIDFPTLNQYFPEGSVIPRYGVYVVECRVCGENMRGVCNVGVRPTVGGDPRPRCETHVFGFSDEIYGERVSVRFLEFLRPETAFGSIGELRAQIARDVLAAREYFERADRANKN